MTESLAGADPGDAGEGEPRSGSAPAEPPANEGKRRLVDELIATGVPAVAAAEAGRRGGRWLASLYVVIPLVAVAVLFGLPETPRFGTSVSHGGSAENAGAGSGRQLSISAQNISFDTDKLTLKAGAHIVIHFENRDASSILHNVAIYQDADADDPIFQGKIIPRRHGHRLRVHGATKR